MNNKAKFGVGDFVDFDTREDNRYQYNCWYCERQQRVRKCVVTDVQAYLSIVTYNLMEIDADPRISAGHHMVSERCLVSTANPHVD